MRSQTQSTAENVRVQVEGEATIEMRAALERGVKLKDGTRTTAGAANTHYLGSKSANTLLRLGSRYY